VAPADFSSELVQLVSRDAGFQQDIDHAHGYFYIVANDTHKNAYFQQILEQILSSRKILFGLIINP